MLASIARCTILYAKLSKFTGAPVSDQNAGKRGAPSLELGYRELRLRVWPGAIDAGKREVVERWYRAEVRQAASPVIARWQPTLGVTAALFFVQEMKAKWGSCNHHPHTID